MPCNLGCTMIWGPSVDCKRRMQTAVKRRVHNSLDLAKSSIPRVRSSQVRNLNPDLWLARDRDRSNFTFVQAFSLVVGLNLSWSATCEKLCLALAHWSVPNSAIGSDRASRAQALARSSSLTASAVLVSLLYVESPRSTLRCVFPRRRPVICVLIGDAIGNPLFSVALVSMGPFRGWWLMQACKVAESCRSNQLFPREENLVGSIKDKDPRCR
jgi:hypothetical protein